MFSMAYIFTYVQRYIYGAWGVSMCLCVHIYIAYYNYNFVRLSRNCNKVLIILH